MRKPLFIILIITVFCVAAAIYYFNMRFSFLLTENQKEKTRQTLILPTKPIKKVADKKSIFVPYWSEFEELNNSSYDQYVYFGITANYQGINQQEAGFLKLSDFLEASAGKETLLTLRLLNDDFNKDLLKNEVLQQKIIQEVTALVKEKKFSGLVLDLELFSLFDTGISVQINEFVKRFYTSLKSDYKMFGMTIYGDNFFRHRPFDIATISENCDEILVMAYDFHKSRGEPGPNFPFARRSLDQPDEGVQDTQIYDYDFKTMVKDFSQIVPAEKLTIIFGMFGYNWSVDEKKRPFAQAKALTLKQIKDKFIVNNNSNDFDHDRDQSRIGKVINCSLDNCIIERDKISSETEINYTVSSDAPDGEGVYRIDYHIVWFEDEESVRIKTEYLKEQGIGSIGYWAWGYF